MTPVWYQSPGRQNDEWHHTAVTPEGKMAPDHWPKDHTIGCLGLIVMEGIRAHDYETCLVVPLVVFGEK